MARKDPDVAALLQHEAGRLAEQLQQRIDGFVAKPRREDAIEAEAKTIAALARAGAAVGAMLAGAERAEALAIRHLDHIDADEHTDTDEGDEMDTDGRSSGRSDPEDLEQIDRLIAERIAEVVSRLESKGLFDRVVAVAAKDDPELLVLAEQRKARAA